jgi:tetratricopeptide (TPR) repeat protein
MERPSLVPFLPALLAVACAAAGSPEESESVQLAAAGGTPQEGAPAEAASSAGEQVPPPAPARTWRLDEDELALWRDPGFKRWFAESYLAQTEVEPRVTTDERERMLEVLEQISADRADKALALLEKHGGPGASAVFDFTQANIHFQADRLEPAATGYQNAVEKHPKFLRAWRNLGLIRVRQGDFASATRAFTRVIELGGGDALTYGLLGYSYGNTGNQLSAESAYRMANLLDPLTLDWKMGLARSFFEQKRYSEASALLAALIADDPERADLWLLQANAFIGLGQPLRAAENFELVEQLGASTFESLAMLGDIYVNQELFEPAVDSYLRALEDAPERGAERAIRAAKVLSAQGAFDQTRRLVAGIETACAEQLGTEQRKDLLKLRARLALADGAGDEGARVLEQIVALDPLDGDALILLGQHAGRSGDVEQAIFWYERAEGLEAFEADAKVRHAQVLVREGRYGEALPLLRRAQAIEPRENVQAYLEQVERVAQGR